MFHDIMSNKIQHINPIMDYINIRGALSDEKMFCLYHDMYALAVTVYSCRHSSFTAG